MANTFGPGKSKQDRRSKSAKKAGEQSASSMSLRGTLAAHALAGLVSLQHGGGADHCAGVAQMALAYADALLLALEPEEEPEPEPEVMPPAQQHKGE